MEAPGARLPLREPIWLPPACEKGCGGCSPAWPAGGGEVGTAAEQRGGGWRAGG